MNNNNPLMTWSKGLLLLLTLFVMTACGDDDVPAFVFDRYGNCTATSVTPLSQKDFNLQVVGSGWKHLSTYEIDTNGNPTGKEYYEERIGVSPTDYYFESTTSLKAYLFADAIPASGYKTYSYRYNEEGNTLGSADSTKSLSLLQIVNLRGDLMKVLVYLGQRSVGGGTMRYVYGYSTYQRMTEKELTNCQETHPVNFDGE